MAAFDGKDVIVKLTHSGTSARICAKTKTLTIGGEAIDITQDCDNGFRKMLQSPGTRSLDIAIEGILEDGAFLGVMLNPATSDLSFAGEITFPSMWKVTGEFFVSGVSVGAENGTGTTISMTLQSNGAWTSAVPT